MKDTVVGARRDANRRDGKRTVLTHRDADGRYRYSYVAGELLVPTNHIRRIASALRAEGARPVRALGGTTIFRLPTGDAVPDVVTRLRGLAGGPVASPNHAYRPALHDIWGTARPSEPAPPLPALPQGDSLPGSGLRIGVVDTGLDLRDWFQGRARRAHPGDVDAEELDEDGGGGLDREAGHGTHVAGIILQHAPGADVIVWSVADIDGHLIDTSAATAIRGLVRDHGVDILNLSFGGRTHGSLGGDTMNQAVADARAMNPHLVVVAAAGNRDPDEDGPPGPQGDQPYFPAAFKGVVSVGAVDANSAPAEFSHTGEWIRCWSLGEDIVSTFLDWDGPVDLSDPMEPPLQQAHKTFHGFASCSGTSFSTPRVTGAIASEMSPDGHTRGEARAAVERLLNGPGGRRVDGRAPIISPQNFVTG